MDVDEDVLARLHKNIDLLAYSGKTLLVHGEAVTIARQLARDEAKYDIIFADPPYESEDLSLTLKALEECDLLSDAGVFVVEYPKRTNLSPRVGELVLWRKKQFGETSIGFYRKEKEKR